mmetsp:Transcript_25494/g.66725  ORF Transcript_25494/g.66725 Transcript_25494/m.66725 type:complete len:525 (-) Transcript_25494:82-1656(-)
MTILSTRCLTMPVCANVTKSARSIFLPASGARATAPSTRATAMRRGHADCCRVRVIRFSSPVLHLSGRSPKLARDRYSFATACHCRPIGQQVIVDHSVRVPYGVALRSPVGVKLTNPVMRHRSHPLGCRSAPFLDTFDTPRRQLRPAAPVASPVLETAEKNLWQSFSAIEKARASMRCGDRAAGGATPESPGVGPAQSPLSSGRLENHRNSLIAVAGILDSIPSSPLAAAFHGKAASAAEPTIFALPLGAAGRRQSTFAVQSHRRSSGVLDIHFPEIDEDFLKVALDGTDALMAELQSGGGPRRRTPPWVILDSIASATATAMSFRRSAAATTPTVRTASPSALPALPKGWAQASARDGGQLRVTLPVSARSESATATEHTSTRDYRSKSPAGKCTPPSFRGAAKTRTDCRNARRAEPSETLLRRKYKHTCTYCGKGHDTKYKLERHVRTHTGEKPFECVTCHSRFNQKSSLKTHSTIHAKALMRNPSTTREQVRTFKVNGYTMEDLGIPFAEMVWEQTQKSFH